MWTKSAYTAPDGKEYQVNYYNLDVIISVDYSVKSYRGTQFRTWVSNVKKIYEKRFDMNDDLLKNNGEGIYFDELLGKICDISSSE